jgi:3-hydroxyisobutyrate dehydrogenase
VRITVTTPARLTGFIGLGAMGEPMALNLARAGMPLVVWNRTRSKTDALAAAGALVAETASDVFERCVTIILMLADAQAIDGVLGRDTDAFISRVKGRTIVSMATVSPVWSRTLEAEIRGAGGRYVEAPVSGSRKPAEAGQLIAMLAGDPGACADIEPLLSPMCRSVIGCGPVPGALAMKCATNIFLIASITGLVEATNFASSFGLDMKTFFAIANASQMASDISRAKVAKLEVGDFQPQAAINNVFESNRLVSEAAEQAGVAVPVTNACFDLYRDALAAGLGASDAIAVLQVLATRSAAR